MRIPIVYGVTHDAAGELTVRLPRSVKVGIGLPKGARAHVCLVEKDGASQWIGKRLEASDKGKPRWRDYKFENRKDAERRWPEFERGGIESSAPEKLSYFTFNVMGKDGTLHPAWDLIELHGPQPTSISICFTDNSPLEQAYRWWAQTKKVCEGDGKHAMRHVDHPDPGQEDDAARAKKAGQTYFPIINGCALGGCCHRQEVEYEGRDGKARTRRGDCAIHTRLRFQLSRALRLGSAAMLDSTGITTAVYLSASLIEVAKWTGGGEPEAGPVAGFELNLRVIPVPNKKYGSTTFSAYVELADETLLALKRRLVQQAAEFDSLVVNGVTEPRRLTAAPRMLAPAVEVETDDEDGFTEEQDAAFMSAQFGDGDDSAEPETPASRIESATTEKAAAIADRIEEQKRKQAERETPPRDEESQPAGLFGGVSVADLELPGDIASLDRAGAGARLGRAKTDLLSRGIGGSDVIHRATRTLGLETATPSNLDEVKRLIWALEIELSDMESVTN